MGKPMNGPEMTDVTDYLGKLGKHANCYPMFAMAAAGGPYKTWLDVTLTAAIPVLVGPGQYLYLQVNGTWPSVDHKTFEGMLYGLCHKLDAAVSERFEQLGIPWEV